MITQGGLEAASTRFCSAAVLAEVDAPSNVNYNLVHVQFDILQDNCQSPYHSWYSCYNLLPGFNHSKAAILRRSRQTSKMLLNQGNDQKVHLGIMYKWHIHDRS
eukprot:1688966-Amphidinium_carterae.1